MAWSSPLALFALLAVPAVLALHLFRRRYRPRRVAAAFLFAQDHLVASAGRRRTPLVRSPSLWLELAAAAAAALWLSGPRLFTFGSVPHVVAVLDDSASMRARGRDGETCAARARSVVSRELERAGGDAKVTLIATGARPRLLAGPRANVAAARAALAAFAPQQSHHDVESALGLARELGSDATSLLFVTDARPPASAADFAVQAVGEPLDNAALVNARRLRGESGERLFVDAVAFTRAALHTTLAVRLPAAGSELATRSLELGDGQVARFEFELPPGVGAVEVALGADALDLDDRCVLLPEPLRPVGVGVRLPAAVVRDLQVGHAMAALGARVETARADADLDFVTEPSDGAFGVQVVVAAGAPPIESWVAPFLMDRREPLLRGLSLHGVIWSAGSPGAAGRGLAFAGEHALLGEEVLAGDRLRVHLNLDAGKTNLATSPDWPILFANLVEAARARLPGPARVNLRLGEPVVWRRQRGEDPARELRLVGADGTSVPGFGSTVVTFDPPAAGEHRLVSGDQELQRFAVHFADGRESDLRDRTSLSTEAAPRADAAAARDVRGEFERRLLAMLLLVLLTLDWLVLGRTGAAAEAAA